MRSDTEGRHGALVPHNTGAIIVLGTICIDLDPAVIAQVSQPLFFVVRSPRPNADSGTLVPAMLVLT